ncbi:scavenger receptor cysteine-rich domain-containing protein DMBT1-like [Amphiura filiformis]|uniref:scavenger receptor cysteine-rich domain-containing protein DMBT1-like n=1 Tax=Amphiura filiformis TaxID=82378 RepID=UPI003B22534F
MGFGSAINTKSVSYGNGDGPVFLSNVRCKGREKTLLECEHVEIMMEDCEGDQQDDVGVRCSDPSDLYPMRLRAFRGSTPQQGIIEISVNNKWGSICTATWTEANSRVVCRGLGLGPPEGRAELPSPQVGGDDYPYVYATPVLERVNCDGSEPHLAFCSHTPWKSSASGPGCIAWQIASITCGNPVIKDYALRLHNASSSYDGHVEIFYDNQWGAVCTNEWDMEDAIVACRQIGLGTPGDVYSVPLNEESITSVVDNLQCTGEERSIKECSNIGFGRRSCNNREIAAITCTKPKTQSGGSLPVRLADGKNEREGRIEIYYNSTWGSVCGTHMGLEEGDVVCRQLGLGRAILTSSVSTGSLYKSDTEDRIVKMWLDNIECVGSEVMLAACSHSQWGMVGCSSDREAGVKCAESGSTPTTNGIVTLAMGLYLAIYFGHFQHCDFHVI